MFVFVKTPQLESVMSEVEAKVQKAVEVLDLIMRDLNKISQFFCENLPKSEDREKLGVALFDAVRATKVSQTILKHASKAQ